MVKTGLFFSLVTSSLQFVTQVEQYFQVKLYLMKLQNLMEETQLNFNKPLLSVRRTGIPSEVNTKNSKNPHPRLPPLPYHKSDLKSGPVRNPGVIPFRWEQSPGRPKIKNQPEFEESLSHLPPPTPKLPPGRVIIQKQDKPNDKELKDSPASSSSRSYPDTIASSWELSSWEKAISVLQEPDEEMKIENNCSSDNESLAFEDARDRLSRTDSFFVNCSVSGVIELDHQNNEDPSEPFLDPRARDFMMGRFLPAAKAAVSNTPQFSSRKCQGIRSTIRSGHVEVNSAVQSGSDQFKRAHTPQFKADLHKKVAKEISSVTEKTVYIDSKQMSSQDARGNKKDLKNLYVSLCKGSEKVGIMELGVSPTLPKSPSESWLSRTLPSMSPRHASLKTFGGNMIFRPSPMDPKRERMLKSCIVREHMLLQPFGELAPILED